MDTKKVLLIKYGEIFLRKGNRIRYEQQLINTLRHRLWDYGGDAIHVIREQGRIVVEDTRGDIDFEAVIPKIRNIFGITAFCLCVKSAVPDIAALKEVCLSFFRETGGRRHVTFKVETKRGDKRYPMTSQEVSAAVGEYLIKKEPELRVDVHNPQWILWIEIRTYLYVYTHSLAGEGGLPYGASGKGVLLLSGGIDSPVAGYLMARRGVEIVPVYFHSPPYTSARALDKVIDITRRLAAYAGTCKLWVVPFTETQLFLYQKVKPEKLTLFLKRSMLTLASRLASTENAHCLITGDSVGQVASQTIHGLEAVDSAASLPLLRPLAAMDKQQIISIAVAIDTYDISIRPYEDCCTLFVAKHPECRPKASAIENIESRLTALPDLWREALAQAESHEIQ